MSDQARLQPRPAFGLRPWFAFLRRARSLRRFAFAMAGRVAGLPEYRGLALTAGTWRIEPVALASSFRGRLAGIHGGDARAILLHTGSVHGSGLQAPLRIVHLTRCGTVVDDEVLPIEGTVRARSYWILELPDAVPAPPQGSVLRVLPSSQG